MEGNISLMVADLLKKLNFETRRAVVSKSRFPNKLSWDEIRSYLRARKATGCLRIDLSQGGTNSILFEEKQDVNGATEIRIE